MTKQIHFLFMSRLDGYVFNPHRPEGLTFYDTANGTEIEIRPRGDEGDAGFGHENLELRVKASYNANDRQIGFVEALLNERTVNPDQSPMELPFLVDEKELVAPDGKIAEDYRPTSDFLPRKLQELCVTAGAELGETAVRFVRLLRWLEKANGPVKVLDSKDNRFGLYWKTSQEFYHSVPWPKQGPFTIMLEDFGGLKWSENDRQTFANLWAGEGEREPLGHQLLREAKSIAVHNSRSAMLICYSALEVGIKQHISKCAPDAEWLAMYAPTPPLYKILRDYLPLLHSDNQEFEKWNAIKSELKLVSDFVEDRNRLAHRGEKNTGALSNYLRVTEDLLYALDVFEGHTWAKSRVSNHFGRLLGWKPTNQGLQLTIEAPE